MNKMEENKTYFGEIGHGLKTLAIGMKTTWKEYFKDFFTNKSTEQYPENRKTTLHVAKRHRGRLVFKRNEDGSYKCTACTLCCVRTPVISTPSSLRTISRTLCSTAQSWCSTSTRKCTEAVLCPTSSRAVQRGKSVGLTLKRSNALWVIRLCLSFSRCSSSVLR